MGIQHQNLHSHNYAVDDAVKHGNVVAYKYQNHHSHLVANHHGDLKPNVVCDIYRLHNATSTATTTAPFPQTTSPTTTTTLTTHSCPMDFSFVLVFLLALLHPTMPASTPRQLELVAALKQKAVAASAAATPTL
eukprot:gene19689-18417_t